MLLNQNDPYYELTPATREQWPRYLARNNGDTFGDGVVYIRMDSERGRLAGVLANGTEAWAMPGGMSWAEYTENWWAAGQVSPMYAFALQAKANGV